MRNALRSTVSVHATADPAVAGVPESWWAPISASPRRDAPRSRRFLPRPRSTGRPSDVSCRARRRPFSRRCRPPGPRFCEAPSRAPLPGEPRRLPSTSARSARCPLRGNDLQREPATGLPALPQWIRLPTLFHRLAPRGGRWLDRGRYRALFTLGRSWPRAARRLLQSKAICKHDLRISKPGLARAARLWRVRLAIHEPASAGPPATDAGSACAASPSLT
jgi:hypothetical protein